MANDTAKTNTASDGKPAASSRGAFFLILALDLLLPSILAGGLVLAVFVHYRFWGISQSLAVGLYALAVLLAAFLINLLINYLLPPFRTIFLRAKNLTFRRVFLSVGGVVIPAILLIGANSYNLAQGQTPLASLLTVAAQPAANQPVRDLGGLALGTENPATRILSIQVLQGIHSPEALNQLIQLASSKPALLQDGTTAQALAAAVASFGAEAKPALLSLFHSISPSEAGPAPDAREDLYNRYFSPSFDSLKHEITAEAGDPVTQQDRLARLATAQAQLKDALDAIQAKPAPMLSDARSDFVLQTFLQMNLAEDADVLKLAQATAADERYPSSVRGDAILLIAKLGSAADEPALFAYAQSTDGLIQARALQAILTLQQKTPKTAPTAVK